MIRLDSAESAQRDIEAAHAQGVGDLLWEMADALERVERGAVGTIIRLLRPGWVRRLVALREGLVAFLARHYPPAR